MIDQTLPFVPMTVVTAVEIDENKDLISNQQQSPIISTLEKREEVEKVDSEQITVPSTETETETVIPITIEVDLKPVKESNEEKTVSPSTPIMSADEQPKPTESPTPTTEPAVVEVPISTLPTTNPLAKLISTMLPNATPFVPSSNSTTNQILTMNNDATPFVPNQHQQQLNNPNAGHWSGTNTRNSGGNNRRGQNPVRTFFLNIDSIQYLS